MKFPKQFQIKVLQVKIAACLREIARGVKKYVIELMDLEGELDNLTSVSNSLAKSQNESLSQYHERVLKMMLKAANKQQMVLGRLDTFMRVSTTIYKRVEHPIKGWSDTKLGEIRIENDGRILINAGRGRMLVPTLEEVMTRFETAYQATQISWV